MLRRRTGNRACKAEIGKYHEGIRARFATEEQVRDLVVLTIDQENDNLRIGPILRFRNIRLQTTYPLPLTMDCTV
jgi:hypothetical protein